MRRVEAEALVGAPRDEVWRLYDDIEGYPRWMPAVRGVVYVSGPARTGAVYRLRSSLLGWRGREQWEIGERRPPLQQVHGTVAGGLAIDLVVRLEGRGTGTWVSHGYELRSSLPGPLGWLHELVASVPAAVAARGAASGAKRAFEG